MTDPAVAPYGSWRRPIQIDDLVGDIVRLAEPWIDGDDVYWLEGRPAEGGRRVLVRRRRRRDDRGPDPGAVRRPDPRPRVRRRRRMSSPAASSSSRDFADGRLYRLDPGDGDAGRRSRPDGPWRYADLRFDPRRRRFVAVREDHGRRRRGRQRRSSTSRSTATATRASSSTGPDFLAAPRALARTGDRLAWLEWDHPDMPWDATRCGRADRRGRDARRVRPRRRRPRRVDRPARVVARRHPPPRLGPQRLVEPVPARRRAAARAARADGGRVRRPGLDLRPLAYGFLPDGSIVAVGRRDRPRPPHPCRAGRPRRRGRDRPSPSSRASRSAPAGIVVLAGAAGRARPSSCASTPRRSPRRASCAGRARWPSTEATISLPEPIEFPDQRRPDRARAVLPAAQPGLRRAADGERPPLVVLSHGGPTVERLDRPGPRRSSS